MDVSEFPDDRGPSVQKRLRFAAILSAAYWLTVGSIVSLRRWLNEYRASVVHYTTETVNTSGGPHAMVVAHLPSSDGMPRHISIPLQSAEDWRALRTCLVSDIRDINKERASQELTEATIQGIELEVQTRQAAEHTRAPHQATKISAHA